MDIKEAITELRGIGYTVEFAPGDKVKLTWQGQGKPDKDKVLPLVEHLKTHKQEVLDLLFSEYLNHVLDAFEGKTAGVHKAECRDLGCEGCYSPKKSVPSQGRLFS